MNELKNKRGGKMQIEFQILDALQKIHTPVLDGVMSDHITWKCRDHLDFTDHCPAD